MMQQTLRASPSIKKRAKSVYSQRNLGTIKDRKREKKEEKEVGSGEIIMRILRMRYVSVCSGNLGVSERERTCVTDRVRRTLSRSSCRSWQRFRQNRSSAIANSRNGNCRGQVRLPAHRMYRLCPKSPLDRAPPHFVLVFFSDLVDTTFFVHHTILPAPATRFHFICLSCLMI